MANIFLRSVVASGAVATFLFVPTAATFAQAVGESAPSGTFGAAQSDFQSSGFKQGGSGSGATTASGATEALKQVNNAPLTVTGAPATQTIVAPKHNNKPLYILLTVVAVSFIIALLLYAQKTLKKQSAQEQVFAGSIIDSGKEPKVAKNVTTDLAEDAKPKPKKAKKSKKKTKKHHR